MSSRTAGVVAELWRYPVKSMLGERAVEMLVAERGGVGDRAWALRELTSGKIASAKLYPRLLEFRASFAVKPTIESQGRVRIEIPGGEVLYAEDPGVSERISDTLGAPVRLERAYAGSQERTGIDPATVFGDVPVSRLKPEFTAETMPDYFTLLEGSFFELAPVHLLASGSIAHLRRLQGGNAQIDQRRFRTNIYIQSTPEWSGFVEDAWLGGTLAIGSMVRITEMRPSLGCVTTTLAQEDLPRDLSVLRTSAYHHHGCVGVYGRVQLAGRVHVGDPVVLLN